MYFKLHSENDCVGATVKVMEYSLTKKEVPKPYQTLLKEIRKDSPVSSWLPSYSQWDTTLLVTFLNQECDVFSDFGNVSHLTHAFPLIPGPINVGAPFLSLHQIPTIPYNRIRVQNCLSIVSYEKVFLFCLFVHPTKLLF